MKNVQDFRKFYDAGLVPVVAAFEQTRAEEKAKFLRRMKVGLALLIAAPIAGGVIALAGRNGASVWVACGFGIAALVVFVWASGARKGALTGKFKSEIVAKLVTFFDASLKYRPEEKLSRELYEASGLFPQKIDHYRGGDLVSGHCEGVQLAFSEIHTQVDESHRDSDGKTHTTREDVFRGVLLVADFNKNFRARTFVLPDAAEKYFGSFVGSFLQQCNLAQDGKAMQLENPEFEASFSVYADNEIEARYILSAKLQERMEAMRKRFAPDTLSFSFVGSKLFMALTTDKDFLELPSGRALTCETLENTYGELASFLGIIEEFDLNVRIWSKE